MPRIRDLGISVVPVMPIPEIGFDGATEPQYLSCTELTCEEGSDSVVDPCHEQSCSEETAQCVPSGPPEVHAKSYELSPDVVTQLKRHLRERLAPQLPN